MQIDAYNSGAASDVYGFEAPFTMRETIRAGLWTQLMFDELLAADQNVIFRPCVYLGAISIAEQLSSWLRARRNPNIVRFPQRRVRFKVRNRERELI